MTFEAKDAVRTNSRLLAAISGPTGSGKTFSGLRVATGLANGGTLVVIDTERGRALDYADHFKFKHIDFDEPHSPQRYIEALDAAEKMNPAVVILDSGSHEWAGVGGAQEMHDAIVDRIAGEDYKKREAVSWGAWNKPKQEDRRFISRLTRMRCHVIVCLRAEEKTEMIDDPKKPGKKKVVPKRLLSGHVGWIPVTGKALPYEFTISLVVTPDKPGVPHGIKLPEPLKPLVPLDAPLSEDVGRRLGEWAKGSEAASSVGADLATSPGGSGLTAQPAASDQTQEGEPQASLIGPGPAAGLDAGEASSPSSLSAAEFQQVCRSLNYSREAVTAARDELFPGTAFNALSDPQRGLLVEHLSKEKVA